MEVATGIGVASGLEVATGVATGVGSPLEAILSSIRVSLAGVGVAEAIYNSSRVSVTGVMMASVDLISRRSVRGVAMASVVLRFTTASPSAVGLAYILKLLLSLWWNVKA